MRESSQRADPPLSRALALARDALAAEPAGLLTDFDGTLSAIVADYAAAALVDGVKPTLERLVTRLAVVAVITGRAPVEARRLTGVPGLLIAGNHGTEWLEPDADEPIAAPQASAARTRLSAVLARLPELPGVRVEHKGLSVTVHYRQAPDPDRALRAILSALGDVTASGVQARHGRMSVELRPTGLGDKGSAARAVIERFDLRGVVVMGDDVTDLDMFRVVADLRGAGRLRAAIVGVGGTDREVPPEVGVAADVMLADPVGAAHLLRGLAGA